MDVVRGRKTSYLWLINSAGGDSAKLFVDNKLVQSREPDGQEQVWTALPMEAGHTYAVRYEFVIGPVWEYQQVGLGAIAMADLITPEAKKLAAMADAAVVCVGFNRRTESEGADRRFELGLGQDELVQAVVAALQSK